MIKFKHLRSKLQLIFSLAAIIPLSLILVLMIYLQFHLLRTEWGNSLQAQARMLAFNSQAAVEFNDLREAERLLRAVDQQTAIIGARLLDTGSGTVLADYQPEQVTIGGEGGGGSWLSERIDRLFAAETITVLAPVPGTESEATVELRVSTRPMLSALKEAALQSFFYLAALLACFIFLASRAAARMAEPLSRLNRLTRTMALDPAMKERFQTTGEDELAQLGNSLNQMVDRLQARDRELAEYRAGLEEQVRQRTQDLLAAVETANQANRAKSDFLARMSHEIRTPMNAIVGLGKLLLKTELSAGQRAHQEQVLAASDMLLGLINDILDYSRIEAGKLEIEDIDFSLDQILREVAGQLSLRAEERGLELLVDLGADVPRQIRSDPLRLRQILVNLINNAIKFTERGEVLVRVESGERDGDCQTLAFSIEDTGIGIPAAKLEQLFSPFTQVDGSITRRFGGSGLGLAIVRQLVDLLGGEIRVASRPGQGSRFSFTIRCRLPDAGQSSPQPRTVELAALSNLRALVVDDNASAREILGSMLGKLGMQVECVDSGTEALARMNEASRDGAPFQLLMVDWLMPEMDGIETVRQIQRMDLTSRIPAILMVTAGSQQDLAGLIGEVGLKHLLTKPVSEAALHEVIVELLRDAGHLERNPTSVRAEERSLREPIDHDFSPIAGARVLLVDDVELNRTVALAFLAEAGLEVDTATNGLEAVHSVSTGDYDLVLMDIQMPQMDGLSATRRIRQHLAAGQLPIIAMTAHAMSGDREASLAAGMNDHLTKPIDPNLLYQALLKWIRPRPKPVGAAQTIEAGKTDFRPPLPAGHPVDKAEAQAGLPLIDGLDTASGLVHSMNRQTLYLRVLHNFLREFPPSAQAIRLAQAEQDWEQARRLAHSLKSAAATIGAGELSAQARLLEQCFAAGQAVADFSLTQLASTLDGLCAALELALAPSAAVSAAAGSSSTPLPADPDGQVSILFVLDQLAQLEPLLRADDAQALVIVGELLEQQLPAPYGQAIEQLRDLIEDIEYEDALEQLSTLRNQLEGMLP